MQEESISGYEGGESRDLRCANVAYLTTHRIRHGSSYIADKVRILPFGCCLWSSVQ